MNRQTRADHLLAQLDGLNEPQLRRLLVEHLTRQKLGLYWESNLIERDAALNANIVLPRRVEAWSHKPTKSIGAAKLALPVKASLDASSFGSIAIARNKPALAGVSGNISDRILFRRFGEV